MSHTTRLSFSKGWDFLSSSTKSSLLFLLNGWCFSSLAMPTFWSFHNTVSASVLSLSPSPCASLLFGLLPLTPATVSASSFLTCFIQNHRGCPYAQHYLFVLGPSVPPLLLLVENRRFKGGALPGFKALGWGLPLSGGTVQCLRQGWWRLLASFTSA